MLLHWCILEPSGPSNLAAIRFASPTRIRSISIFPTDAKPFAQNPEIIARTEPETFYLNVFFNAHPIHPILNSDSKERHRAPNALVPSVIAYAGGQMDFTVDMGSEYATRLMIVKGKFGSVSMAVYGDLVSEIQPPPQAYEPKLIPSTEQFPLSRAVDPSNSLDPTMLAKQLLALIAGSPPLPLIIRLMLCLKPSNDDWDLPDFPYLYADLDEDSEEFDLEKAYQCTNKPVPDDISQDIIQRFADRIAASIGPKNGNQSYLVAGILCQVAPQHPDMARILMETLDLEMVFDAYNMDELTVLRLLDAAANVDIARHLSDDWFLELLQTIQGTPVADRETQYAVRRLAARIRGWQLVEDALSNTQANFNEVARIMKDIGTEEKSFGIWLESMITHRDLVAKLAENPVLHIHQSPPPSLLHDPLSVSHDEFIAFVRAYIGVSSVLAVYAWSDSVPNVRCRERALGVLRLWQSIDGYREIVNHLLLLRQMTFRLECLAEDHDPPTPSGVHVEHILVDLAIEPQSILRHDLVKCILSLKQPLSYITEDERLTMRKVALVADYGLAFAIEELTFPASHPMDMRRLRILRVSLAILERELQDEKGEWRVLQALWEEGWHGLLCLLVDIFVGTRDDLKEHFLLSPPPRMAQKLVEQLFRMAADVLKLIARLAPAYPLTSRSTCMLIAAIADIFVHTDAADMLYSQSSASCIAAQGTRQTCIDLVRRLSDCKMFTGSGKPSSEIILRTLLEHGVQNEGRDPVNHLVQVYCLIDHLLPLSGPRSEEQSHWVTSVIPNVIAEIRKFFRVMDTENKVHFVKRLVNLDSGVIGIGEWLLIDELKHLYRILQSLDDPVSGEQHRLVGQHQVFLSLRFILDLIVPPSCTSTWCITSIETLPEAADTFASCLMLLLDGHIFPPCLLQIMQVLPAHSAALGPSLRFAMALTAFRAADISFLIHSSPLQILKNLPEEAIDSARLQAEIGHRLSSLAISEPALAGLDGECAETLLLIMEWLFESGHTKLSGITTSLFAKLCNHMGQTLPADRKVALESVRAKLAVDQNEAPIAIAEEVTLSENLEISIENIENLLTPIPVPSTPKGTTPDLLGLVAVSPPIAILRSPAATGLTKTYSNNDFRQLRTLPSARQNTSRLPSMHVDDFESSPTLVPVPMPDAFPSLSSAFNPQ